MRNTFVKQHDATDCAAACLAMVCLHYRKETTITQLRDMMGTDLKGTNLVGLSRCVDALGFTSQAVRVDRENFLSDFTLPCIANVITKEGLSHFVVVFKKIRKKNVDYVVIGDPARDLMKITLDEFYQTFTGTLLILKPNTAFESGKNEKGKIFSRFIKLLLPHKKLFVYSIIASLILTVLGICSSLFNKILMDEILPYKLENSLLLVVIVFAVLAVVQTTIGFVRQWMMIYLSQKIDIPLLLGYFEHIYKLPMKFFASRKTGDIITRFSDAFTIKDIFTNIALTLIIDVAMALITGIILLNMNLSLFGIIICLTICSILLVFIFRQPYKKINEEQMQQSSALNSQIIEGLRAVETIKGNANEDAELESIEKEYIKSLRIGMKEGMLSTVQGSISGLISTAGNLILMYFGIRQVIDGNLTLGSFMAFTTMAEYFMDPVGRLVSLQLQIQEANISMKRITEILDYDTEQAEGEFTELESVDGDIEINNVTFRYGNRKPVLNNISFTIPKGKKVALVGESGSGKSTIAKLLLKYYEPENGEILIDGVDINEYENESVRRTISYVPQTIELFSKSIYDNIRVSKMNSTLEEVKQAAKEADAHDFIKKLPMQYHTYLQEAGNGLSGGEKQRIALARAFLKKSNFYILDESTSNLDFATENIIFDMIYNKFRNKSMLIIAHRLATIRNCDLILVLDKGEIIEQGTHDELLAMNGRYSRLWNMQQGNFVIEDEKTEQEFGVNDNEIDDEDTLCYI
ncbi:MAG: peptidase domain-containing ABC transporter [Ruminococcus sp.]|nr:peptidase domain-containing ABC transporter [Ruminococcus sp.]